MKLHRVVFHVFALALVLTPAFPQQAAQAPQKQEAAKTPRPLEFKDAPGWKRVAAPTISNDGQWFVHKLVPNEGDSEVVLRRNKDGAVDFTQGIEYFNQLRRLQKQVVMLQYKGENHGLRVPAKMKDYAVRMKEFFDHQLMGKPAPQWWKDGVPHLKLKEHLEERAKPEPEVTPLNEGENR